MNEQQERFVLVSKVTKVVDGDTFLIADQWEWRGQTGRRVRPTGYNTPEEGEEGYEEAGERLRGKILGEAVVLDNPVAIDRGRLVCRVCHDNVAVAYLFPDYTV